MQFMICDMHSDDDIRGKAYVHWKSWQETYSGLMPDEFLARQTLEKCTDIAFKWREGILVAKIGERVIGFAGYGAYRDETLADTGELFALYVLREYHGKGVGHALLHEVLRRLSAYSATALWVLKGNERAIRFYQKEGFAFDGAEITNKLGTELRMLREK